MKLYIVRHADKEKGDFYNENLHHQDPPISFEGKQNSVKLVNLFENKQVKKIIVSQYLRAAQTAQYISEIKELPVIKDQRLNEIDNGVIEQMSDEEIQEKYPEFWNDFFSYSKDVCFPEGETGEDVKARQKELLDELLHQGEDSLLITHEGYIRLLLCHLLNIPVYKRYLFHVDFCGVSELDYNMKSNTWKIIRVNQIAL